MAQRALIMEADKIAREKGLTQSQWSRLAGYANNGQTVSRIVKAGDCRISTFNTLLNAIGYKLKIEKIDEN